MSKQTMGQRSREAQSEKNSHLSKTWKVMIYLPLFWTVGAGWFYVSGMFAHKLSKCVVELSVLDNFMANSIGFAGALSIFSIWSALQLLESRR